MDISPYKLEETLEIVNLYTDTFTDSEGEAEGKVIGDLVAELLATADSQQLYCLIAKDNDKIVGAIIFSKLIVKHAISAYILSPVAVSTNVQKKGIGQQLINYGIDMLKSNGVELLFTYGDPNYYHKVGFKQITEQQIKAPQPLSFPHGWLCQSLTSDTIPTISGTSYCTKALNKPEYW